MRPALLSILAEPGTGASLVLEDAREERARIVEGRLRSTETGVVYPIVRGIPRFVSSDGYSASFGMQWNRFRRVQVDSETAGTHSRRRFDNEAGWSTEQLEGKWCLDAGCGAGRFAEIAAARKANLVALDLSSAVDATAETCRAFDNVDVVQGSMLEPPFKPGSFDFAYSLGVIQHTPDPQGAVRRVIECVKPGGRFALTIYARRPWTKLNAKYLVRPLTKRLPEKVLLGAIETVMPVMFPVTDALYRLPVVGRLAQFTIPIANWVDRDEFTRPQRYDEAVLDTFDMLSPAYDDPMTWQEVENAMRAAGATDWSFRSRVPIICEGRVS
ncbi:MAG: methyltransferase domain-containing protein [Myxococcota bacterium]|nr:methyltransferase domain-containing protein [Myxococcota bacterium]